MSIRYLVMRSSCAIVGSGRSIWLLKIVISIASNSNDQLILVGLVSIGPVLRKLRSLEVRAIKRKRHSAVIPHLT